ncbi:MAG: wax ester/triacylglycerol synthase family O-acyltransferase [Pseudomonadota bacterium]
MQQLSAQDASFIYLESPATPMHVGSISIYDGNEADSARLSEDAIIRAIQERLHLVVTTRRKCVRVPFEADYPYWVEDQDFDLEYHVRRVGLPRPGDWAEFKKLTARIFARPLDMTKPLWEFYIIDGLDHMAGVPAGSFALLAKTHHAAIDGASGVQFMELMHDLEPGPVRIPPPDSPWRPEPVPNDAELMLRTGLNNLSQPMRMLEAWSNSMSSNNFGLRNLTDNYFTGQANPGGSVRRVPKTRFNGAVSPHRVIGSVHLKLEAVRRIKKLVAGATVNDAILTICGGALRKYLLSKNELDEASLVAMAPVNARAPGTSTEAAGNKVSALFVPIGTDIEDPLERLLHIQAETSASKLMHRAIGAADMTDYAQFVPAYTAALASRLMTQTAANAPIPPFNVSITNVPGPQIPLYFCGAPMISYFGLGPITQGMGLIMPILSYRGDINISFTSCREIIPDPDFYEECILAAYDELMALTANQSGSAPAAVEPNTDAPEPHPEDSQQPSSAEPNKDD